MIPGHYAGSESGIIADGGRPRALCPAGHRPLASTPDLVGGWELGYRNCSQLRNFTAGFDRNFHVSFMSNFRLIFLTWLFAVILEYIETSRRTIDFIGFSAFNRFCELCRILRQILVPNLGPNLASKICQILLYVLGFWLRLLWWPDPLRGKREWGVRGGRVQPPETLNRFLTFVCFWHFEKEFIQCLPLKRGSPCLAS